MKVVRNEIQLVGQQGQIKQKANLSAICAKNGSSTVSARKMRRIEQALARKSKNKLTYAVNNA